MQELHPLAPHTLPSFIIPPGGTDRLLIIVTVGVTTTVVLVGVLFFWLHSLPERMAHKAHKFQIELIAVLCLLSLFTHVHLFWVAALVLAFLKIPEFALPDLDGSLNRIAKSVDRVASKVESARTRKPHPAGATDRAEAIKQRS